MGKKEIRNERYHQSTAVVDVAARAHSPAAELSILSPHVIVDPFDDFTYNIHRPINIVKR